METIGIIAAMAQESVALLRLIGKSTATRLGRYHCHHFQLSGRNCWLITSGMGVSRAAQATRTLVDAVNPSLLVSVGIAGAVNADLEIGDVVASGNTCRLDQGVPGPFQSLAHLSAAAQQAAEKALQTGGAHLYLGTAVTTHGSQFFQNGSDQITNPVLEMETTGIAGVAGEKNIPLLSLRSISDGPRAPIPFNLEAAMDEQDNLRYGEILKAMLKQPKMVLQFPGMVKNTRLAADNAAVALVAALSQPGPVLSS